MFRYSNLDSKHTDRRSHRQGTAPLLSSLSDLHMTSSKGRSGAVS